MRCVACAVNTLKPIEAADLPICTGFSKSACMNTLTTLLGDPFPFLSRVFQSLVLDNMDVTSFELDHICYRVATVERYVALKTALAALGTLLTESNINGRPIATFKLETPIIFESRSIYLLELPAPKASSPYAEGYEHVEFVIPSSLESFIQAHPDITFDTSAMHKPVNPDVSIAYDRFRVKFHTHPLEYVIQYLD